MSTLVKLQRKGQMVIPRSLRERAGIPEGTLLEVALVEGGNILITPQLTINRGAVTIAHSPPWRRSTTPSFAWCSTPSKNCSRRLRCLPNAA